jgi:RimJ/RimL family protein N-acetyltransferase
MEAPQRRIDGDHPQDDAGAAGGGGEVSVTNRAWRASAKPLDSERFHYRPLGEGDRELYIRIYTDPVLMQHVGDPLTITVAENSFQKSCALNLALNSRQYCWVMIDRESGGEVGLLALIDHNGPAEIGVMVLMPWQNRKVAQEAIRRLTEFSFRECSVSYVFTRHLIANIAGAGVMARLGFLVMSDVPGGDCFQGWGMGRDLWVEMTQGMFVQ